ncbi:hypothetical protein BJ166DRAFT_532837, partial [Pestalotiopsis sp. NC0098]
MKRVGLAVGKVGRMYRSAALSCFFLSVPSHYTSIACPAHYFPLYFNITCLIFFYLLAIICSPIRSYCCRRKKLSSPQTQSGTGSTMMNPFAREWRRHYGDTLRRLQNTAL